MCVVRIINPTVVLHANTTVCLILSMTYQRSIFAGLLPIPQNTDDAKLIQEKDEKIKKLQKKVETLVGFPQVWPPFQAQRRVTLTNSTSCRPNVCRHALSKCYIQ